MKFFSKTPAAIFVMIIAILLSSLFGGRRSLLKEQKEVEDFFYNGSGGDGYSIQDDLEYIGATANNFKTVAARYIESDHPLITSLTDARLALASARTIPDKYLAAAKLSDTVTALHGSLDPNKMNSTDKGFRASLYDDITSAMQRISHNGYNDAAREFNAIIESFPAKFIAQLGGIKPAQLYA